MSEVRKVEQGYEVTLSQKEFEALMKFVDGYGKKAPNKMAEWRKGLGYKLWDAASTVIGRTFQEVVRMREKD